MQPASALQAGHDVGGHGKGSAWCQNPAHPLLWCACHSCLQSVSFFLCSCCYFRILLQSLITSEKQCQGVMLPTCIMVHADPAVSSDDMLIKIFGIYPQSRGWLHARTRRRQFLLPCPQLLLPVALPAAPVSQHQHVVAGWQRRSWTAALNASWGCTEVVLITRHAPEAAAGPRTLAVALWLPAGVQL